MFQFKCPAGHLVQADESHAGQTSSCPTCGMAMVIPGAIPSISTDDSNSGHEVIPALNSAPAFFHIPCPNGHILETPADMIGEYAKCPTCDAEFDLREKDSEEYRRRKEMMEESELANLDRKWLNRAIAIVILLVLGGVALVIATVLNR